MKQETALGILKTGKNVFLTGQAGSGKTYVLNQYIEYLKSRGVDVAITASTGIAATHIEGSTIHSWSGLGITQQVDEYKLDAMQEKKYLHKRFDAVSVLVIDEISMITAELLGSVDRVLQAFKRNNEPFGGIQVILSGDFFQLPPVTRGGADPSYAWKSPSWQRLDLSVCYLQEQYRQEAESPLNTILNEIRDGSISERSMEYLRSRYRREPDLEVRATKLYTHNKDVDRINEAALAEIEGHPVFFEMKHAGNPKLVAGLEKSVLAPANLSLKIDAHVIFVKNNYEKGYMNGSVGVVRDFTSTGWPLVELVDGRTIEAEPETWSIEENGKPLASVTQVPLRLAWAITVHKSQGMSLDAAEIDLTSAFESGQGYVALSRLRTLAGLKLMGLGPEALLISDEVRNHDKHMLEHAREAESWFENLPLDAREEWHENFLDDIGAKDPEEIEVEYQQKKHRDKKKREYGIGETYIETAELVEQEYDLEELAVSRELTEGTIVNHLRVIKESMPHISLEYLRPNTDIIDQVSGAVEALGNSDNEEDFSEDGTLRLKPIFEYLEENVSYDDIRLVLLFL